MRTNVLKHTVAGLLTLAVSAIAHADGPPQSNGVISNPTLVQNQDVAKAQAAGAISSFMNKGAQSCDSDGKNCHSVFGSDDTPDYTRLQQSSQSLTGVQAFSFLDGQGSDDGGSSNAIASQMGTLAVACGDTGVKKVAGIVVKLSNCQVTANGDAQVTVQVCSAPVRTNPVTPPKNEVQCSSDPTAPNFRPPAGYVCHRPACDTEPVGSLDGWSQPQTISWQATLPSSATDDQKSKNGLGLIFYPPLNGQIASFTAESDNMTAVKIVQSFVNNETKRTAIGLKVAYRHKTQVTKDMMVAGPSSVPNPSANTAQWDTVLKLQGNEKIPQYQKQYAANGTECLQQIQGGIAKDGKITVCDPNYTNESGIKPLAKTAQVATEGQDCGTTPQCLNKVVNTTTWTEMCSAEVPMAMRNCSTKQDYTIDHLSYTRTRTQEVCHETRNSAEYSCNTTVVVDTVLPYWDPIANLSAEGSTGVQTVLKFERRFTTPLRATVIGAAITSLHVDNWMEIRLNGTRIWASLNGNLWSVMNGDTYHYCDNETWTEHYSGGDWEYDYQMSGVRCTQSDGQRVQANYNDDCIWHCTWSGNYAVNIPIDPKLVRESQSNVIEVACFNNLGPSACNFEMKLQYIPWESFKTLNYCEGFENSQ